MKRRTTYSIVDLIRRDGKWYGGQDVFSFPLSVHFKYSLDIHPISMLRLARSRAIDRALVQIAEYMSKPCELWSEM